MGWLLRKVRSWFHNVWWQQRVLLQRWHKDETSNKRRRPLHQKDKRRDWLKKRHNPAIQTFRRSREPSEKEWSCRKVHKVPWEKRLKRLKAPSALIDQRKLTISLYKKMAKDITRLCVLSLEPLGTSCFQRSNWAILWHRVEACHLHIEKPGRFHAFQQRRSEKSKRRVLEAFKLHKRAA